MRSWSNPEFSGTASGQGEEFAVRRSKVVKVPRTIAAAQEWQLMAELSLSEKRYPAPKRGRWCCGAATLPVV